MSEKLQFDELLGGSEKLPRDAQIIKLASARAIEIAKLTHSLENPQQTKLIFQKLPVHMRRRVMSHNAKRMPRKLRNGHISQMTKSGLPPKTKRPSRKYRRRPKKLLEEYNRRQRNKFWLETHIWHAKRFKMIEKWGFKLPDHANDRCFRANYRAVTKHCLIQDISYYICLEISGPEELLKENLKMHCNPNELTFAAKIFMNGEREGSVMFYKKNSYPYNPIGYVHFLWKYCNDTKKCIWIWVHPAFYGEVLYEVINDFNFVLNSTEDDVNINIQESQESQEILKDNYKDMPPEMLNFTISKVPSYHNNENCQMLILKNCLNRFRLCGPLTSTIIANAFKIPRAKSMLISHNDKEEKMVTENEEDVLDKRIESKDKNHSMEIDSNNTHSIDSWFNTFYEVQNNLEAFEVQKNTFDTLKMFNSPSQLPRNIVIALTVLDPRFFLPQKRTKSVSNSIEENRIPIPQSLISRSPLWDCFIRNYVSENTMTTSAINALRSQNLIPGVENDNFFDEGIMHKIPIILIQKPGNYSNNNSIGFGSGFDIILPANWSMPFWLSLILRSAKPGGLRESKSIAYENSNLNVPAINHPDTEAYKKEANFVNEEMTKKYFRLPPNKRINYMKFGITSPFYCEWNLLMKEWSGSDGFYVLRDSQSLTLLSEMLSENLDKKVKKSSDGIDNNILLENLYASIKDKNCYVPIKVTIKRQGLPKDFSIICLPTAEDLTKFNEDKKWLGPVEFPKTDPNEEKRKTLRKDHKTLLKRLRKQRVRAKKKMENVSCELSLENSSNMKHLDKMCQVIKNKITDVNKTIIDQQSKLMANLYLPKCKNVKNSCDREVIGYVTQGGFSFSEAKGVGLGYVVLSSVLDLIKHKQSIVLTRNTTTKKYRMCKIEVLSS